MLFVAHEIIIFATTGLCDTTICTSHVLDTGYEQSPTCFVIEYSIVLLSEYLPVNTGDVLVLPSNVYVASSSLSLLSIIVVSSPASALTV